MIRTSNLSAFRLLRRIEYWETSAPIIWRWLVWMNAQGFTAGLPALEAECDAGSYQTVGACRNPKAPRPVQSPLNCAIGAERTAATRIE
jgi:hypothetical protein